MLLHFWCNPQNRIVFMALIILSDYPSKFVIMEIDAFALETVQVDVRLTIRR